MTLVEQIQKRLLQLTPEKQREVLDFVSFLQIHGETLHQKTRNHDLQKHPAFGSWKKRSLDSLSYEESLRAEWDNYP